MIDDEKWRDALTAIQNHKDTSKLAELLLECGGVMPWEVAFHLGRLLIDDGSLPVVLAPKKSGKHTYEMQRARNYAKRVIIGERVIHDRNEGMSVENAIMKQCESEKKSRDYIFECYEAARVHTADPVKYEEIPGFPGVITPRTR